MNLIDPTSATTWSVVGHGSVAPGAHRGSYRPGMWSVDAFMAGSSFASMANGVATTTCAAGNVNGKTKRSPQRLGESLT